MRAKTCFLLQWNPCRALSPAKKPQRISNFYLKSSCTAAQPLYPQTSARKHCRRLESFGPATARKASRSRWEKGELCPQRITTYHALLSRNVVIDALKIATSLPVQFLMQVLTTCCRKHVISQTVALHAPAVLLFLAVPYSECA